jgi:hypothetical protein
VWPFADGIGRRHRGQVPEQLPLDDRRQHGGHSGGGVFSYGGQFTQTLVTGNTVARSVCATAEERVRIRRDGGGGILGATV